jgi:predicted membrane metal-binding protein
MPKVLRFPIAAAIGAQLLTAPILISRFGLLYPIGLLSGLVLTPLVTAFMWGGLALVFLPLPERFARLGSEVLGVVHHVLSAAAEFFARANPVRTGDWGSAILLAVVVLVLLRMPSAVRFLRLKRKEIDLFGPEHPGRRM